MAAGVGGEEQAWFSVHHAVGCEETEWAAWCTLLPPPTMFPGWVTLDTPGSPPSLSFIVVFFFFLVLPVYCYQPISLHPHAHMLSHVTPWTAAHQALLSMDFSRQEYWIGLPFPSPRLLKERAPSLPSPPREGVWAMLSSKKTDGMHHEVRRRVGQCIRAFGTHWL